MADFAPESTIYLFQYTRVDANNQPYFESEGDKLTWYFSHANKAFNRYSYQRTERRYIRVEGKADRLRIYDMLAFQNGSSGKWIFAGITSIDFINPNCAEITFEIDYMQTYIENITWRYCFVEREMQENDWNGALPSFNNLVPEGIEGGSTEEYSVSYNNQNMILADADKPGQVIMLSALNEDAEPINAPTPSQNATGVPSICHEYYFQDNVSGMADLKTVLDKFASANKLDAILGFYYVPQRSVGGITQINLAYRQIFKDYIPVNAKCYTSEFFNWVMASWNGDRRVLKPEGFRGKSTAILSVYTNFRGGSGGAFCSPTNYMEQGQARFTNPDKYGVAFPFDSQLAWGSGGYYNYASQHIGAITAGIGDSILGGMLMGSITGNPVLGASVSALNAAYGAIGKITDSHLTPISGGNVPSTSSIIWKLGHVGFYFYASAPAVENIKCIDDFFSMYGYKTNRVKLPNVNTRPLWNYVKTAGAIISGPFDRTAKLKMQEMLDNGVTFWHVPAASIGDYSNPEANKG